MRDVDESSVSSSVAQEEDLMNVLVAERRRLPEPPETVEDDDSTTLREPPSLYHHEHQHQQGQRHQRLELRKGQEDEVVTSACHAPSMPKENRVPGSRLDAISRLYGSTRTAQSSSSSVVTEEEDDTNHFLDHSRHDVETASANSSNSYEEKTRRGRNFLENVAPSNKLTVVMAALCTMIIVLPVVFSVRNESSQMHMRAVNKTHSTWGNNETSAIGVIHTLTNTDTNGNASVGWRLEEEDGIP